MISKHRPKKRTVRKRSALSVPCPECGSPSRVYRTTLGPRSPPRRAPKPRHVVRERRCLSPAHHKFTTEERAR